MVDAAEVAFTSSGTPFSLTRYDPADITDDDRAILSKMLNNIMGIKTIRNLIEDEIRKIRREDYPFRKKYAELMSGDNQ